MRFTYSSEDRMNELVEKANKSLKKLGVSVITIDSVTSRKVCVGQNAFLEPIFEVVYDAEMTIPSELVKVGNQEVLARLESIENLNMITRISKSEANLDEYRDAPICCDHCGYKRNRKGSWVVKSEEKGLIQIGDNCVNLYFGVDVEKILKTSHAVMNMLCSDEERCSGSGRRSYNISGFVARVMWLTMTTGFLTQKKAEETMGTSTRATASFLSEPLDSFTAEREKIEYHEKNAAFIAWKNENYKDVNIFEQVLDWWMSKEDVTEFEHNCKAAVLSQNPKFLGLTAYATKLWVDANAKVAPKVTSAVSEHVGAIKERRDFSVKVTNLRAFEGAYGPTTQVSFEDENGNQLVWWASVNPGMTLGQSYKIKATVTKHSDFKGVKQTTINRCTVEV